jgi:hypothetical protein
MKEQSNVTGSIDHALKLYQFTKQIEEIKKERRDRLIKDSGSYEDLLKYRRGKSKY